MATSPSFTAQANDALTLTPRRAEPDLRVLDQDAAPDAGLTAPCHPKFTYPVFGDDETVWGYKGLKINIDLASGSLHQLLTISYAGKTSSKTSPPDDIEAKLKPYLAPDYTTSPSVFASQLATSSSSFRPFGTRLAAYSRPSQKYARRQKLRKRKFRDPDEDEAEAAGEKGMVEGDEEVVFEVWKTSWADAGFKEYHRRMRFFIPLWIEGGQFVNEDEDLWEFAVLYEKRVRAPPADAPPSATPDYAYHFAGFASLYPFFYFPDRTRLRLSQFFILPAFQEQGHGQALYNALYASLAARPQVAELTVEDPSEAFEDLRDVCDLRTLAAGVRRGEWAGKLSVRVGDGVDREWVEAKRRELKLAPRQFSRLYEMLLLFELERSDRVGGPASAAEWRAFRLFVKERLYRFNYEMLQQVEPDERKEKLETTFDALCESYRDLLERADLDI